MLGRFDGAPFYLDLSHFPHRSTLIWSKWIMSESRDMKYEEVRLSTFRGWPANAKVIRIFVSRGGIYKRNKKVRKQENKNSTKKVIKKKSFFSYFSWSLSWSSSCFLDRFFGRVLGFFLVFLIAFLVEFLFSYFLDSFYKFPPLILPYALTGLGNLNPSWSKLFWKQWIICISLSMLENSNIGAPTTFGHACSSFFLKV